MSAESSGSAEVFSPKERRLRRRVAVACPESEMRTKQAFRDECNINVIMERWRATGEIWAPNQSREVPRYGDFTNVSDYLTACSTVRAAERSFAALPARVRARFENSPGELMAFLEDPANREEAIELGLLDSPSGAGSSPAGASAESSGSAVIPEGGEAAGEAADGGAPPENS